MSDEEKSTFFVLNIYGIHPYNQVARAALTHYATLLREVDKDEADRVLAIVQDAYQQASEIYKKS